MVLGGGLESMSEEVQGFFDGYRGGAFEGWAWRPDQPEGEPLSVEVYANGFRLGEAEASIYRPDLRVAGVGHGRYGFSLTFPIDLEREDPVQVRVRIKDGPRLAGGEATIGGAQPLSEKDAAAFQAFLAAVLGTSSPRAPGVEEPGAKSHFIVYCPTGEEAHADMLGSDEYSYTFVLKAFAPVLARFGEVHVVDDPATQVDLLYRSHLLKGETSIFLSFAPPHRTTLGLRCPVIPVIAWEYPTIPDEVWDGERRHDWRWVLRQTGRVVTLSILAARAVKAAMGRDYPVVAIAAPVWDRAPHLHGLPLRLATTVTPVEVEGFILDIRDAAFDPDMTVPRLPAPGELPDRADLDGVVFTSVFAPKDGRKNWADLVTAFLAALGERRDATLVLKIVGSDPDEWWWEFYERLSRVRPFACRLVVIHGFMPDARYAELIAASHWVVSASNAEGLCLPLVEFMCTGRPAIAPVHTAMADYFDAASGLVVHSDEQYCGWPHDTRMGMSTLRHQVSWSSLRDAYAEGYRLATQDPARHYALGRAASARMKAFCSDAAVAGRLSDFLGLGGVSQTPLQSPEPMTADAPA